MNTILRFTALITVVMLLCHCSQPSSHRQSQRDQNEANTNTEKTDLEPAEGDFSGTMRMRKSKQTFDFNLSLRRVYQNLRPTTSQDPTQTVTVLKLSGALTFPVLQNIGENDYTHFGELLNPMGNISSVIIDYGDYDPKTHLLILPYGINGYTLEEFGNLTGYLNNGVFKGKWYTKVLGIVGDFEGTITKPTEDNP